MMFKYNKEHDMMIGHDYPGRVGNGFHHFMVDELELGARVAHALDDPDQWFWEIYHKEMERALNE